MLFYLMRGIVTIYNRMPIAIMLQLYKSIWGSDNCSMNYLMNRGYTWTDYY